MSGVRDMPLLLLVEHDGLVRSTVAAVARKLELAQVEQAASLPLATQLLAHTPVDGLLISLNDDADAALDLLTRVRAGGFRCAADLPVVAMAHAGDAALVLRLKQLDVRRLLLQPFKLRDVIHTLEQLWPEAVPA